MSRPTIEYNVLGISEVPSKGMNLNGAIAKSDMHLLGVGDSPEVSVSERRVGGGRRAYFHFKSSFSTCFTIFPNNLVSINSNSLVTSLALLIA